MKGGLVSCVTAVRTIVGTEQVVMQWEGAGWGVAVRCRGEHIHILLNLKIGIFFVRRKLWEYQIISFRGTTEL